MSPACLGEEENEFANHGTTDLLDKLDAPMDLQGQIICLRTFMYNRYSYRNGQ